MNSTTTRKRLLAARVLLALALLLTVLAVFLPFFSNLPPFDDPSRSMGPSLNNFDEWREGITLAATVAWLGGGTSMGKLEVQLLVMFTGGLLQVSSVWLVRLYHQSRPLCWVARALALICGGLSIFALASWGPVGLGVVVWVDATLILFLGLFLIPHSRRELPAGQGEPLPEPHQ